MSARPLPKLTPRAVALINKARAGGLTVDVQERTSLRGLAVTFKDPEHRGGWVQLWLYTGMHRRTCTEAAWLPSDQHDSRPVTLSYAGYLVGHYLEWVAAHGN